MWDPSPAGPSGPEIGPEQGNWLPLQAAKLFLPFVHNFDVDYSFHWIK